MGSVRACGDTSILGGISLEAYADLYEQLTGNWGLARAVPAKEHPCYKSQDLKQASAWNVGSAVQQLAYLKTPEGCPPYRSFSCMVFSLVAGEPSRYTA